MDEDIGPTAVLLNKTESLFRVEPLHGAGRHAISFTVRRRRSTHPRPAARMIAAHRHNSSLCDARAVAAPGRPPPPAKSTTGWRGVEQYRLNRMLPAGA